jgi:hypothetical protein
MGFVRFIRDHIGPAVIAFFGAILAIGGTVLTAKDMVFLVPSAYWAAVGITLFMSATIWLLYRFHTEHVVDGAAKPLRPAHQTVAAPEPWNPQGLYVGLVHVDTQHLEKDLLIEIAARFFNGTGATVDVSKVTGWITYFFSTQMKPGEGVKLPVPQLLDDRGGINAIAANHEGQAVLGQRVPREVASRILEQLANGETLCLSLDGLNLIVEASSHDKEPLRMPLWNAVTLKKDWPVPFVGRLITVNVSARISASTTVK